MKTQLICLLTTLALCASLHRAAAPSILGTPFTYQGRLNNDTNPANGSYDLSFSLYNVSSGGVAIAGPLTNSATGITNGLFTVTLDFGSGVFSGIPYWLDISVRTNGNGAFTELSPRQQLTPVPYAIFSESAGTATTANGVAAGSVTAADIASGQVVKSLNGLEDAVTLSPGANVTITPNGNTLMIASTGSGGGSGWSLIGNSNTIPGVNFLGTSDNEPLEMWVNGARALRLEPGPNVIGGASNNMVSPGLVNNTIGGGYNNTIIGASTGSTIAGGSRNTANGGTSQTVGGGTLNTVSAQYTTVSGGTGNTASTNGAVVGGGGINTASGRAATVGGGELNTASGDGAFVGGGGYDGTSIAGNIASGKASTVPGGLGNQANGDYSFAAGNSAQANNTGSFVWADASGGLFPSTADNQFSVRAANGVRFFTPNNSRNMTLDGYRVLTTFDGGGGGGGSTNGWLLTGNTGADPAKGYFLGTSDTNALELRVQGFRALRLEPGSGFPNVIGGSIYNSVVSGTTEATISGGSGNTNAGNGATIAGGSGNHASGQAAAVGGGAGNTASGTGWATVGGGSVNTASGVAATVPGGANNTAAGYGSFAAGQSAHTTYDGTFVWGDGTQVFNAAGANQFDVLATGGVLLCDGGAPTASALLKVQTTRHTSVENTATFAAPNIGPNESHIHYGSTGDWYIRSASSNGKVVLQDTGGRVGIGTTTPQQTLDVNGGFVEVQGGGAQAAIGGLSAGGGVMIGSFDPTVTTVSFQNLTALGFPYMHINCSSITIEGGADLAEPFQISAADKEISQGAVVVIDEENPGHLKLSDQPYDTRVAGVVSGANGINPGIQMQQQGLLEGGKNVALTGRVYVMADASNGAIKPGDLLTSSATPGHAMKVSDHARAQGAILGKAMTGLTEGKGTVLLLVTLQ